MQRKDFPLLKTHTYLDSAGTVLKPKKVVKAISEFYLFYPINNHNIDSPLGFKVEQMVNQTREKIANFIGAKREEIIFTSGTTDSLNKIAQMLKPMLKTGDEILLSLYNHDSNLVPWIELSQQLKLKLVYSHNLLDSITKNTKIISYAQQNNTIVKYFDRKQLYLKAQENGAIVINDAAQAIAHQDVSFKDSDVIVFSGNKLYGPTGIGVLAVKTNILTKLKPVTFGGGAINQINSNNWIAKSGVEKFEPGTLNLAGIIGLSKALDYFKNSEFYKSYEIELAKYAHKKLKEVTGIKLYSLCGDINIIFNIKNYAAQDVANYLGKRKIIVRAGMHCAHMLNEIFDNKATIRISIAAYNNHEDIDNLVKILSKGGDFLDIF